MRAAWRGPDVELVVEPTASITAENAARTLPLLVERGVDERRRRLRAAPRLPRRGSSSRGSSSRTGSRPRSTSPPSRRARVRSRGRSRLLRSAGGSFERRGPSSPAGVRMSDTLVFIPAWNEEQNLPAVLDDLARDASRARTCSSSTTARPIGPPTSRASTARRCDSLGENRGLPVGIAAGYRWALEHELRVLRAGRRRRPAPGGGARAAARARARRPVRRRGRVALRLGRRVRAVPVPARARRAASARRCCGGRWRSCCGGRSATRRAGSTRSTRRRCRCSPRRSRPRRPRSRR